MNIVCLCTALPAESRPLIEQFQLRLRKTRGLRCYYGESVYLVETGIGKLKSASAVAAVLQSNDLIDALINVGIAGGAAELGSRFIAGTVVDNASGEAWHPHLPSTRVLKDTPTSIVHTLDKPSADYQADVVFDMEASGVFTAASKYLDNSRIQCLKTISDNHTSDFSKLKKEDVSDLVGNCLQQVTALVNHFHAQPTSSWQENRDIDQLIKQMSSTARISVSDSHSIKRLLQRISALDSASLPSSDELAKQGHARDIKSFLESRISDSGISY